MKHMLFATLSLVSDISKYNDENHATLDKVAIEKQSTFVLSGVFAQVNDFYGVNVNNTGIEDYFYTFQLEQDGKVYHNEEEIHIQDIKEGDKIKITYDGSISLVYPPKLNNVTRIDVLDDEE